MKKTGLYKLACASAMTLGLCGCADVPDYMEECGGGRQWLNDLSPTVNFNTNGGADVSPASAKTGACGTLKTLPVLSRTGYIFDAWYTEPAGGNVVSANYVFYGNATIYAQWIDTAGSYDDGSGRYDTVKIGNQIWMKKNLNRATRNSWCYGGLSNYCREYGRLYKWEAAKTACPDGWRLPTQFDWIELAIFAGGGGSVGNQGTAGFKLKSRSGWNNDMNGDDTYGFTALPGGYRHEEPGYIPRFTNLIEIGYWWSSTEAPNGDAFTRVIQFSKNTFDENYGVKTYAFSVRCLKN